MLFRVGNQIGLVAALIAMALSPGCGDATPPQATVRVSGQVVLRQPPRLGVNIGESTYYNDMQVVNNALSHGGFAKGRQALLAESKDGTANSITDARVRPEDPDSAYVDSFKGGRYSVMSGARAGETGAIVEHIAGAFTFTLEKSGPPFADGDLVMLHGPLASRATPIEESNEPALGIGDFRVSVDEGVKLDLIDNPANTLDQAVRVTFPGTPKASGGLRHYVKVTPSSSYRVRVRARSDAPGVKLDVDLRNFGLPGDAPGNNITFRSKDETTLTNDWREILFTGGTDADLRIDENLSLFQFTLTDVNGTAGGTAYIDSVALEDETLGTPSGFNKHLVAALKEARCGVLRFYGNAGLGSLVDNFTAKNNTDNAWSYLSLKSHGRADLAHATTDDWMKLCLDVGAAPWVTVGSPNGPEEWYGYISYLCAPADFDDASRRRAEHGFAEPWSARFDTIYLELGNEWWNGLFAPYHTTTPEKYAALCKTILAKVRAHPHYDPKKIKLIADGWAVNGNHWNGIVDVQCAGHDYISIAPYLLHALDRHESPEERYGALFADVDAYAANGGQSTRDDLAKNGKNTQVAVYELNTHLTGGEAPASVASAVCTSAASGVAVLDQALSVMRDLHAAPVNYFTALQRAFGREEDARTGLWGVLLRESNGALRPRPVWQGLRLANNYLIDGDMVETQVVDGPTWAQSENGSVPAMPDVPYLHAYAFLRTAAPGKRAANVLVVNRQRNLPYTVRVELPFKPAPKATSIALSATRLSDNNEVAEHVSLAKTDLTLGTGAVVSVKPFSATVFQFEEAN